MASLHDLLQVDPSASQAEIRASYVRLAAALHPDMNRDYLALQEFKQLSYAYSILGDKRRRKLYEQNPRFFEIPNVHNATASCGPGTSATSGNGRQQAPVRPHASRTEGTRSETSTARPHYRDYFVRRTSALIPSSRQSVWGAVSVVAVALILVFAFLQHTQRGISQNVALDAHITTNAPSPLESNHSQDPSANLHARTIAETSDAERPNPTNESDQPEDRVSPKNVPIASHSGGNDPLAGVDDRSPEPSSDLSLSELSLFNEIPVNSINMDLPLSQHNSHLPPNHTVGQPRQTAREPGGRNVRPIDSAVFPEFGQPPEPVRFTSDSSPSLQPLHESNYWPSSNGANYGKATPRRRPELPFKPTITRKSTDKKPSPRNGRDGNWKPVGHPKHGEDRFLGGFDVPKLGREWMNGHDKRRYAASERRGVDGRRLSRGFDVPKLGREWINGHDERRYAESKSRRRRWASASPDR